jgi:hypothetical protein
MPLLSPVGVRVAAQDRPSSRSRIHTYFRRSIGKSVNALTSGRAAHVYSGGDAPSLANTGATRLLNLRDPAHGSPLFDPATAGQVFGEQ